MIERWGRDCPDAHGVRRGTRNVIVFAIILSVFPAAAQTSADAPVFTLPGVARPHGQAMSGARPATAERIGDAQVSVGGRELVLPGPASEFEEVGDKLRVTFFDLLVPPPYRLLTAYVSSRNLADLNAGKAADGLNVYGMLEVARAKEYVDCTPRVFEQALEEINESLGALDDGAIEGELREIQNDYLRALGAKSVELGRSKVLGRSFQKTDAAGYLLQTVLKKGNRSIIMIGGMAALRVRQRLIFANLWRRYESPESLATLRQDLATWADTILIRNE